MAELSKKIGELSLAILENLVEKLLGEKIGRPVQIEGYESYRNLLRQFIGK